METPALNAALDHTLHIPIAELSPSLAAPETRAVKAIVTLTWPFSSATGSLAFLLSEPDFRLRQQRGQVRVQFAGSSAKHVSESKFASGDEVLLCLDGVEWIKDENKVATPGTSVEFELRFSERLLLKFWRQEGSHDSTIIDVDHPPPESELSVASILPDAVSDFAHLPAVSTNDHATPRGIQNEVEGEYASPAFLKRARTSYGSLFELDPFLEEDGSIARKGRKRTRLSAAWTYSSRSPTPESEASSEPELPNTPQNIVRPTMTDEGCQTVETELGDAAEALTTFSRQAINVGSISYTGSIIRTEATLGLQPASAPNAVQPPAIETQLLEEDPQSAIALDAMPRSPRLEPLSSDLLPLVSPLISRNPAFPDTNFDFSQTPSRQNSSILDSQEDLYAASPQKSQSAALPRSFTAPLPLVFGAYKSSLLGVETVDDPETQPLGHSQSPSSGSQVEEEESFQTNNDTDYGEHGLPAPLDLSSCQSQYPELHEGDHPPSINKWGSRVVSYPDLAGSSIVEDNTLLYSPLSQAREASGSQSVRSRSQIVDLTDESDGEQEAFQYDLEQQEPSTLSTDIAHYLPSRNSVPISGSQAHHEYDAELDPQDYDEEEDEDGYEDENEENRRLQTDPRSRHSQEHGQDGDKEELEEGDGYEMDENGDLDAKPHLSRGSNYGYDEDGEENMYSGYEEEAGSYEEDESEDASEDADSGSGPRPPPEIIDLLSSDEDENPAPAPVDKGVNFKSGFQTDLTRASREEDSDSGDGSSEASEDLELGLDSFDGSINDDRDIGPQDLDKPELSDQSMGDGEDTESGVEEETATRHESIREESVDSKSSVEDHNSEYRMVGQSPRSTNIAVAIHSSPLVGVEDSNRKTFIDQESNIGLDDDNGNEEVSHSSLEASDSEAEINIVENSEPSLDMEDGSEEEMGTPEVEAEDKIDSGDSAEPQPQILTIEVTKVEEVEALVDATSGATTEAESPHDISGENRMEGIAHFIPVEDEISDNQKIGSPEPENSLEAGASSWNADDFASRIKDPFGLDGTMDEPMLDSPPRSQMFREEVNIQLPTPDDTQVPHQMLSTETSLVTVTESQNSTTEMQQVSTETHTLEAQRGSADIVMEYARPAVIQDPTTETADGGEGDLLADLESSLTHSGPIDLEIPEAVKMVDEKQPDEVADMPTDNMVPVEKEQQATSVVEVEKVHVTEGLPAGPPNDPPVEGQDMNAESGTAETIDDLVPHALADSELDVQPTEVAPAIISPRRSQRHVKSASIDGQEPDTSLGQEGSFRDATTKDASVATEQASSNLTPDVQQEAAIVTRRSRRHKGASMGTSEESSHDHQVASDERNVAQDTDHFSASQPESEVELEAPAALAPPKKKKPMEGPPSLEDPTEIEPKIDETTIKSPRRSHRRTRSSTSNSKESANPNKVSKAQQDANSSPSQESIPIVIDNQATPKGHDASVELALSSFESPSKHYDLRHPLSHLTPVADLKIRLLRNLRTELSEFTTLKMIPYYLNNNLDVLAVVTSSTPEPQRSKGGPRHYQIYFHVTDPSIAPNDVTEVQVFRPYKEALPVAQVGDAILLRNFTPVSVEGGFALHSNQNEASSWAVFKADTGGVEAEMRGPPVEYGSGETTHIEALIKWFKNYDQKALAKFTKTAEKGKEVEKRKAAEPTKPTMKLRSAD